MADQEIADGTASTAPQSARGTRRNRTSLPGDNPQKKKIRKVDDDPCNWYNMNSNPRGLCVIINNTFEKTSKPRKGTEIDKARLQKTFERLRFVVKCYDDLKANKMRDIIKSIAEQDHGAFDCFACCILSHGDKGVVLGEDWFAVDIHDLTKPLRPGGGCNDHGTCCPSLKGKPKMYFIQACQGKDKDEFNTDDAEPNDRVKPLPNEADFLLSFATVPGYVAYRSPLEGSRYIQTLCDLLDEYAYDLDMLEIMTLLNNTVGQLPEDSEGTIQKQAPIAMTTLPEDSEGTIQKQAPIAMTTLRKKVIFEVLVTGRGVQPKGVRVNDKVDFCVHTEGEVDIFITGPDNSHQMCDKEKVDTRWICTYTPSLPGKYKINLNCSGGVIAKSPIEIEVLPERKGVPVKAYGPGLQGGRCEQDAVFTVDVDVSSDLDKLSFSLPRSLIIDDEKRTHDEDRIVELRYRPKYPGQYAVHVLWDGEDIPDSPFMVNIEPAAAFQAEKVDAWGPGLKSDGVVAGKRCTFTIDTRRAVKLAVQCIDEDQEPVDVEVMDNEDGTYSCSYVPVKHHRHIKYITYGGSSDRNSPFIVDAWGPGLKSDGVVAGKRCTFTIDTRRAVKLAVQCIDEDQEPVHVEVKDNEDGTYSCSYVPVKHHRHIMYITYGGSSDRNSPFICKPASSSPSTRVGETESSHPDLSDQSTLKRVGLNWPNIRKNDMHQYTRITSLLATDCGRLLMADILNQSVKELKLSKLTNTRQRASPVECAVEPWGLAILKDGRLAVTSATSNCICLRDIKGSKGGWWPFGGLKGSKVNVIKTVRKYCGVACGGNSTLIVSCKSEGDQPASVDIIGLTGELLRTIVTSREIDDLKCPDYIHMMQGELLIADRESHAVLRLDFPSGKLMAVHKHKDLKNPCQIATDRLGNVYVASKGGRCILAIRADGKWRNLLKADDLRNLFSSVEHLNPHSVTVTTDSQPKLIVGWQNDQSGSAVTCHVKDVMS